MAWNTRLKKCPFRVNAKCSCCHLSFESEKDQKGNIVYECSFKVIAKHIGRLGGV